MDNEDQQYKDITRKAMAELRRLPIHAPDYLETRVVAAGLEKQRRRKTLNFWKSLTATATMGAVALVLVVTLNVGPDFTVSAKQALMVRVDVQEFSLDNVALAEIVLPNGVNFYAENLPKLAEKRSLLVPWSKQPADTHFAFAIRGEEMGVRKLEVRFLDKNKKLIIKKELQIKFELKGEQQS